MRIMPINYTVPPPGRYEQPTENWCEPVTKSGERLTKGNIFGILREDETIGYAPQENAVSANGWW